ncbi:hypothetical protein QQS21_002672 [Conoideocrella luteorostrata]|uniref:Biotrophy-associated secreted protein 2 n=1 Tax=Conoideocrella luteorostrata TaxID=1105319 RepID=A0AAJ0CXM2_9HYPO|nr:hypothetical protein QQS21_002672 [Conoideocrella luteorostrata]
MVRITVFAALTFALSVLAADPAGDKNIGNGQGKQFITGGCLSNADCASKCCAQQKGSGVCSGLGAQFEAGKTGCGFVAANGGAKKAKKAKNNKRHAKALKA